METDTQKECTYLAVLPLQVLAEDTKVAMFCEGLVMDIITDLSRFRSFQIISYDTTKSFQSGGDSVSSTLDELNLDYLVKGVVRCPHEKLMLNLQLIDTGQKRLVWAEKFNGKFDELFQIQENIVEKIVASLQLFVNCDLLSKGRKKTLTNLNVYECYLKGNNELKKGTIEGDRQARIYFQQAIKMDPHYPRAYTGMSLSFFNELTCQFWSRWEINQSGAFEWAQKALELDEWDHVSNAIIGRIYLVNGEFDKAEHFLRKSLRINPNDAETLMYIAFGFTYLGYAKEAMGLINRATRLNPADSFHSFAYASFVHFELGEYEKSIELAEKHEIGSVWVDFPAYQAAAYYLVGNLEKMRAWWETFLSEFSRKINGGKPTDSQTALEWMITMNPYRGETKLKPFWDYMSQTDVDELRSVKSEAPSGHQNQFSQEGGLWTVSFDGKQIQLSDLKGYHDIARLLAVPAQSIHCTDLIGAQVLEKGGEVFDEKAKTTYQRRIRHLQQEIEEAKTVADTHRLGELQDEYDQIINHLSRATGKGGKVRNVSGTLEKCRTAVTWRIRSAIKKVAELHPALGKHLEASIKTGIFCEYSPEHEVKWTL